MVYKSFVSTENGTGSNVAAAHKEQTVAPTDADVTTYLSEHVCVLDQHIRHTHLFEDATDVVLKAFPDWKNEELRLVQCKDGITNKLVRCIHQPSNTSVLIRAYGRRSEVIIDRKQEITVGDG